MASEQRDDKRQIDEQTRVERDPPVKKVVDDDKVDQRQAGVEREPRMVNPPKKEK